MTGSTDAFCAGVARHLGREEGREFHWPPTGREEMASLLVALERDRLRHLARWSGWMKAIRLAFKLVAALALGQDTYDGVLTEDGRLTDILFSQTRLHLTRRWEEMERGTPAVGWTLRPRFAEPDVDRFRQQPCTPGTATARAELIAAEAATPGLALMAGDDDLVSVALARKGGWQVEALDADPRVLATIRRAAAEEGVAVRVHDADLTRPLPPDLRDRFDVLAIDPPYSRKAAVVFLRTAVTALKTDGPARIYLALDAENLGPGFAELEADLAARGFARVAVHTNFNEYPISAVHAARLRLANRWLLAGHFARAYEELPSVFNDLFVYARSGIPPPGGGGGPPVA